MGYAMDQVELILLPVKHSFITWPLPTKNWTHVCKQYSCTVSSEICCNL